MLLLLIALVEPLMSRGKWDSLPQPQRRGSPFSAVRVDRKEVRLVLRRPSLAVTLSDPFVIDWLICVCVCAAVL